MFVPGVLPGERVRIRVAQRRGDFDRAALVEVLEPLRHRVGPGLPVRGHCGGCDWLHIAYEEQLRQKVSIVAEALRRTGHIEREDPPIEPSEPWHAAKPGAGASRAAGRPGVHGRAQRTGRHRGRLPDRGPGHREAFSRRGQAPCRPGPIHRLRRMGTSLAVEGGDDGRELAVDVAGQRIVFSVGCFFQSNLGALQKLVPWALAGLEGGSAADLYCGVGLFGSFLAAHFARVICVESSAMSLSYARRNVPGASHEFYPMAVEQWIQSGAASAAAGRGRRRSAARRPRHGGPRLARDEPPGQLVYVSCNPVTLARDLADLTAAGASSWRTSACSTSIRRPPTLKQWQSSPAALRNEQGVRRRVSVRIAGK